MLVSAPLVSIGIPTVRRLAYLGEAVRSALAQSYTNIEVLISQDCTLDRLDEDVAEWGREAAANDSRVRYFSSSRPLGLAGNWNRIAERTRGRYLVIIGDDDRLLPTFVAELVDTIEPRNANVAFSNHWIIDSAGRRLLNETERITRVYGRDLLAAGLVDCPIECVWRNSVPMSASMIRTADVARLRFREDLNTPELEFHARLAADSGRYAFNPKYLAEYRLHATSETSAGLRHDRLIEYLSDIPVPPELESVKCKLLAQPMFAAVNQKLAAGDIETARHLVKHKYYPHFQRRKIDWPMDIGFPIKVMVQTMLVRLPPTACILLLRGQRTIRRYVRRWLASGQDAQPRKT